MKKKKKFGIILLVVLLFIGLGVGVYFFFFRTANHEEQPTVEVKVMNEIPDFGYKLDDRDSELFKEKFNELKELLEQENYEKESYVSLVAQLFIIDLYTIQNKISKYDVGGLEYVYEPARESFKSVVMDSIYKTVINNIDKKREQNLPIVSSVSVQSVKSDMYTLPDDTKKEAYLVSLKWEYEQDYDYDTSGTVSIIVNDKKMDVVSFEPND